MIGLNAHLVVLWCIIVTSLQDQNVSKSLVKKDLTVRQNSINNGTGIGSSHKLLTTNEWLRGLFDHYSWNSDSYRGVSEKCSKDLRTYLEHLRNGSMWAAQSKFVYLCIYL